MQATGTAGTPTAGGITGVFRWGTTKSAYNAGIVKATAKGGVDVYKRQGYDSMIDPKKGTVTQPSEDRKVTLTATFQANDTAINTYVEKVGDFGLITKTFEVTVKGKQAAKPTEDELKAILDKYYTCLLYTSFSYH